MKKTAGGCPTVFYFIRTRTQARGFFALARRARSDNVQQEKAAAYILLNTTVAFVPPKPKLLLITELQEMREAWLAE